jgi:hypothetical protein
MAGTVVGQPPRKRLRIDDDPFGPVGDYAGSFLVKSAVELRGGYDTNPGRTSVPRGSPFYVVAPEFVAFSDWERHAIVADLRGSFTGYTNSFPPVPGVGSSAPTNLDRRISSAMSTTVSMSPATPAARPAGARRDHNQRPERAGQPVQIPVYATFGSTPASTELSRLRLPRPHDCTVYQYSPDRRHLDRQRRPP